MWRFCGFSLKWVFVDLIVWAALAAKQKLYLTRYKAKSFDLTKHDLQTVWYVSEPPIHCCAVLFSGDMREVNVAGLILQLQHFAESLKIESHKGSRSRSLPNCSRRKSPSRPAKIIFFFSESAAAQNRGRSGRNCASSIAKMSTLRHSASPRVLRISLSFATEKHVRRIPSWVTIWSHEYLKSSKDLTSETTSPSASSWETLSRSSVVFPENMGPVMRWISPVFFEIFRPCAKSVYFMVYSGIAVPLVWEIDRWKRKLVCDWIFRACRKVRTSLSHVQPIFCSTKWSVRHEPRIDTPNVINTRYTWSKKRNTEPRGLNPRGFHLSRCPSTSPGTAFVLINIMIGLVFMLYCTCTQLHTYVNGRKSKTKYVYVVYTCTAVHVLAYAL
mgnify:CR=1 FL=1